MPLRREPAAACSWGATLQHTVHGNQPIPFSHSPWGTCTPEQAFWVSALPSAHHPNARPLAPQERYWELEPRQYSEAKEAQLRALLEAGELPASPTAANGRKHAREEGERGAAEGAGALPAGAEACCWRGSHALLVQLGMPHVQKRMVGMRSKCNHENPGLGIDPTQQPWHAVPLCCSSGG